MKRLLVISLLAVAPLFAGCAGQTGAQTPATVLYQARSLYDAAVLAPSAHYAQLPACPQPDGQPCHQPEVLAELQKADYAAEVALDAAEEVVKNHPELDASAALDAAQSAIEAAQKIAGRYGIKSNTSK